jgi:hypothetical protein
VSDEIDMSVFDRPLPEWRDRVFAGDRAVGQIDQARAEAAERLARGKGSFALVMMEESDEPGTIEDLQFLIIDGGAGARAQTYPLLIGAFGQMAEKVKKAFLLDIVRGIGEDDAE